jgi:transposase InsO family protein
MDPEFVAAVAGVVHGENINISQFCRDHGISRGVFHKYVTRFRTEGTTGFTRRSTAPHHHPTQLPPTVAEAVLRTRKELADQGWDNGPISIHWRLETQGFTPLPSHNSVYRILCDHGQIVAEPRKRPKTRRRFEYTDPNGLWQIDGMDFYLAGGEKVCVLQIIDDHSRLDVCCYAAKSENSADTWAALTQAINGYGVPVKVLSDNGSAFSGKHRGGMADTERHLAEHGVTTIASSVHHPQTCGKNERVHKTLRQWLAQQPTPDTLTALQLLLDEYRVGYNNRRHQSLGGLTPQQRYDARPAVAPTATAHPPAGFTGRPVSTTGVIAFAGCSIVVGRRWAGRTAVLHWQGDRVSILIDNTLARILTLDHTRRYQPLTPRRPGPAQGPTQDTPV